MMHMPLQQHSEQKGVQLEHGPYNYTDKFGHNWFSNARTTFYEETELFDESKDKTFFVVLAQVAEVCRARLKVRLFLPFSMHLRIQNELGVAGSSCRFAIAYERPNYNFFQKYFDESGNDSF